MMCTRVPANNAFPHHGSQVSTSASAQEYNPLVTPHGYPRRPVSTFLAWLPTYSFASMPEFVQMEVAARPCELCGSGDYKPDSHVRRFRCCHAFHAECANAWLVGDRRCPTCSKDIEEMEMAHRLCMDQDVGGATRRQILGYNTAEFGVDPRRLRLTPCVAPAQVVPPAA